MLLEIFREAWAALGRNPVRSLLTMTGIAWGIVAVTLLLSYGSGFRNVLMFTFEVFGKGAVICWPGTTSEQAGGERAGKAVRFEQEDADWVKAQSPLVKRVTRETVKWKGITHDVRLSDTAIRGVREPFVVRNALPLHRLARHALDERGLRLHPIGVLLLEADGLAGALSTRLLAGGSGPADDRAFAEDLEGVHQNIAEAGTVT